MKKLGNIINVIIMVLLLAMIAVVFIPVMLSKTVISLASSQIKVDRPYKTGITISLSPKDKSVMDDIYVSNEFQVNPEFEDVYNHMILNMGGENFEWKRLYSGTTLKEKNPFDGRSLEFSNISDYDIRVFEWDSMPFLYKFLNENRESLDSSAGKYNISPDTEKSLKDRIFLRYEFSSYDNSKLFKELLKEIKNTNTYRSFFSESRIIEEKLLLEDGVSGLNDIIEMLIENSSVKNMSIKYKVFLLNIETVEISAELDYVVNGEHLVLEFYMKQDFEYMSADEVGQDVYFSNLTNIEDLVPDKSPEDVTSDVGMVENPLEGGEVPGLILSDFAPGS